MKPLSSTLRSTRGPSGARTALPHLPAASGDWAAAVRKAARGERTRAPPRPRDSPGCGLRKECAANPAPSAAGEGGREGGWSAQRVRKRRLEPLATPIAALPPLGPAPPELPSSTPRSSPYLPPRGSPPPPRLRLPAPTPLLLQAPFPLHVLFPHPSSRLPSPSLPPPGSLPPPRVLHTSSLPPPGARPFPPPRVLLPSPSSSPPPFSLPPPSPRARRRPLGFVLLRGRRRRRRGPGAHLCLAGPRVPRCRAGAVGRSRAWLSPLVTAPLLPRCCALPPRPSPARPAARLSAPAPQGASGCRRRPGGERRTSGRGQRLQAGERGPGAAGAANLAWARGRGGRAHVLPPLPGRGGRLRKALGPGERAWGRRLGAGPQPPEARVAGERAGLGMGARPRSGARAAVTRSRSPLGRAARRPWVAARTAGGCWGAGGGGARPGLARSGRACGHLVSVASPEGGPGHSLGKVGSEVYTVAKLIVSFLVSFGVAHKSHYLLTV